jgi:hypothetical protein
MTSMAKVEASALLALVVGVRRAPDRSPRGSTEACAPALARRDRGHSVHADADGATGRRRQWRPMLDIGKRCAFSECPGDALTVRREGMHRAAAPRGRPI